MAQYYFQWPLALPEEREAVLANFQPPVYRFQKAHLAA